ncbi:MAG: polyprenyl synthetase family protein [Acidimicrobiia bacterium]
MRSRTVPEPPALRAVAARVERRLADLLTAESARWSALSPDLAGPYSALERFVMNGGKRLRPAFCFWGFVGAGGDPQDPAIVDAGAAFEMLQAFALVHDDVMDGSSRRRGTTTLHLEFVDRHHADGWRGEARRFGEGVAVLVGDLAHVYADQLLPSRDPEVLAVWDELRLELNAGQLLDVLGTARGDTDPVNARRISRYKSGKYTIERPLHVGAALAGRLDDLADQLSAYGDPLGEAFQLRDDLLGAFGDEAATGKPVGDDLREGKPTPLLATASARAGDDQARALARVGDRDLDEGGVRAIQDVLVATGAVSSVEARIDELTATAIEAVSASDLVPEARTALVELARFVAHRRA